MSARASSRTSTPCACSPPGRGSRPSTGCGSSRAAWAGPGSTPRATWSGSWGPSDSGKRYRLVLFDATADGDDSNDPLIVDVNGDGRAQESEPLTPGGMLELDGVALRLKAIAPSGRRVVLAPA